MNASNPIVEPSSNRSRADGVYRMSLRLPNEAEALRNAGISIVRMGYEGRYGDRQIEVTFEEKCENATTSSTAPVEPAIRVFFSELLEIRFPGWETAEGSRGLFEWSVELDTLEHRHEVPITEYRSVLITND
ncbi:MAG: hypothetical protein WDO56_15805 [Gammaproteobacteria bacterium]